MLCVRRVNLPPQLCIPVCRNEDLEGTREYRGARGLETEACFLINRAHHGRGLSDHICLLLGVVVTL